ncbi:hypothetical protein INT43_004256 [Umbelopsis isabellina]|uniref:Uncharacterized protein n=1 Tax=Mortierella isabellina TaxID=91625 RepID=A0A8H7PI91_MORIS|nr:hypothetical protein INT43_004256 [Umbelopsis isabellina]
MVTQHFCCYFRKIHAPPWVRLSQALLSQMGDSNQDIEAETKSAEEVGAVESTTDDKIQPTPDPGKSAEDEAGVQETSPSNHPEVNGVNNEDTPAPSAIDQSADQSSPESKEETSNHNQPSAEQNPNADMAEEKKIADPSDQPLADKLESDMDGSQNISENSQQSDSAETKATETDKKGEESTVEAQELDKEVNAATVAVSANGGELKDDDDAASIASSGHSDAYESAGEAPGTGETSEARASHEFEKEIEAPDSLEHTDNTVIMDLEHTPIISPNGLSPREQEKADEAMQEGIDAFFGNRFMRAKYVFKARADKDPLYALGLGSMAFIKAIMTYDPVDIDIGMVALSTACSIAQAQIDAASAKRPIKEAVSHYLSSIITSNKTGLPDTPKTKPDEPKTFLPNGVLRAHVVKAEGSLLIGMLHLCQENVTGYIKCGLSIRRAYKSYSLVWQEYKKMGQAFHDHIDKDTVSAIQFGIGSVHILLSSLPPKVLKAAAAMGWKPDKNLGFALLKLCQEGKGIRSPLASLMLLAYYTVLTSIAPQLFASDYSNPALECLVEAQKQYPDSCFYLLFTGRVSRLVKNIDLSTQSLECASDAAKGEWAEAPMKLLTSYDIAMNDSMSFEWEQACAKFEYLRDQKYWSPAYFQYFVGACHEITGNRTEAILAFASVPKLIRGKGTQIDKFVKRRVEFFEESGYADLDFSLPALELLLIYNAFPFMKKEPLEQCLVKIDAALELVYEREKLEYEIRLTELAPEIGPPEYYDQRAQALLIKAAVLNALGKHNEAVLHLNWIIDHGTRIKELWVLPFCYWEAGITSWALDQRLKARKLWETGLTFSKYEFDYRMAIRYNVVLNKCDDLGIYHVDDENIVNTTNDKLLPVKQTV